MQVARREAAGALDPFAPLAVREVAVEVQVDAALGGASNQSRLGRSPSSTCVGLLRDRPGTTVSNQSRISGLLKICPSQPWCSSMSSLHVPFSRQMKGPSLKCHTNGMPRVACITSCAKGTACQLSSA